MRRPVRSRSAWTRLPRAGATALACAALLVPATLGAEEAASAPLRLAPLRAPAADAKPSPPAWLGEDVNFRKGYGLEYRRPLRFGDTPLDVGVLGPVVRKKKSVGLTLEVRF